MKLTAERNREAKAVLELAHDLVTRFGQNGVFHIDTRLTITLRDNTLMIIKHERETAVMLTIVAEPPMFVRFIPGPWKQLLQRTARSLEKS